MAAISDTGLLAQTLIREESVSPQDGRCQQIMSNFLRDLDFEIESMPFGPVSNLWATRAGTEAGPLFVFAGHTDVVPTGPLEQWQRPPYAAEVDNGMLHGRGAADMKGSLAAMMTATERFLSRHSNFSGSIGYLITSDEEDVAEDGTFKVMDTLASRNIKIDYCVIGEPSSSTRLGDVIRVGRRGSLNGSLTVKGIQGHVAYPDDARNPIHEFGSALAELAAMQWDNGNEYFPPTSFQISNIHAGTGANNVIPGDLKAEFNFRFSTETTQTDLEKRTTEILARHLTEFDVDWRLSGPPFLTSGGRLIPAVQSVINDVCEIDTELSTSGGTSDGRFIAPRGVEVVELGPCNATIHKINECVSLADLDQLSMVYESLLERLLVND